MSFAPLDCATIGGRARPPRVLIEIGRRFQCTDAPFALSGALALALSGPTVAQEAVPPPQQTITDFSAREIPADKRVVMSQDTEVLEGVDAATVPHYRVDPFWPKPLPNNWVLGQVSGVAVAADEHVWIVHRPGSLSDREVGRHAGSADQQVLLPGAAGGRVRRGGQPGATPGAGRARATTGSRASTASMSTTRASSGSAATATTTTTSSSSPRRRVRHADRDAGRRARAATTPRTSEPGRHGGRRGGERDLRRRRLRQPPRRRLRHRDRRLQAPLGRLRQRARRRREMPPTTRSGAPCSSSAARCTASGSSIEGRVYVCDRDNNRYQVFEKDGTFVEEAYLRARHSAVRARSRISSCRTTPSSASSSWSTA